MCNHDFSRVSFAAELSTKLVYNSAFVKDYDYIFCICYYISTYIYIYIKATLCHRNEVKTVKND